MDETSKKKEINLERAEVARRIHNLAEEVSRGTIRMGEKSIQVPDQVRIEMKAEKDEFDIELKWR